MARKWEGGLLRLKAAHAHSMGQQLWLLQLKLRCKRDEGRRRARVWDFAGFCEFTVVRGIVSVPSTRFTTAIPVVLFASEKRTPSHAKR